jgi:TP53 regulating kinase-like protein
MPGRLIHKGAEADILLGSWSGRRAIYKVRRPLPYRLAVLDSALRHQRTVREAEMIKSAKDAGVAAPFLYFVDPSGATLVMEYVEGRRLKEVAETGERRAVLRHFEELGKNVAKLHAAGLMHGDITTANVIVRGGELVFIDFGLSIHSLRLEDRAVDLRLIKETLTGAHSSIADSAVEALVRGYASISGAAKFKAVARQLREIERRGRYARLA